VPIKPLHKMSEAQVKRVSRSVDDYPKHANQGEDV
jgi:hypothetical protein